MFLFQLTTGVLLCLFLTPANCELDIDDDHETKNRTPVYIIANMANTISEAETFMADGANGLQIDVKFSPTGIPKSTHHGLPCYCRRDCSKTENFKDYLEFLRRATTPGTKKYNKELSIIFMNLKIRGLNRGVLFTAGEKFADDIINFLYARGKAASRAWIILGLPDVRSLAFVRGFRNAFEDANMKWYLERFGYSVSRFSRPDALKAALAAAGVTGHVWVGTGSPICNRRTTPQRVIRLANEREIINRFGNNFVDKVYSYTIDLPTNIRESLRLGIDAVITNKPNQLKIILKEAEFEPSMRLADSGDVPWRWPVKSRSSKKKASMETQYSLALDEIDKELEKLNAPAEEDPENDEKDVLEKLFSKRMDKDKEAENDKSEDTIFQRLFKRVEKFLLGISL